MKTLKHISSLSMVFVLSLFLFNCEKVKPEMDMVADPGTETAQMKAAEISSSDEIIYLISLIVDIESLVEDGTLNNGQANALIVKIENAIKSLDKGNDNAAENQLGAFTCQVEVFVENSIITGEQGESLISYTEIVINQLNGLTYVPDDNFEQALIELGLDSPPLDDYVPTTNIETITSLDLQEKNITELTGIRSFASLRILDCNFNQLTSLDVSSNTALTLFNCYGNQLSSLDVSNNTALTELNCGSNLLTSLDVSNNTSLVYLNCFENQLSILDVSNNTALTLLMCAKVQLSVLDVSNNIALTTLVCSDNQISVLDVSNNIALTALLCGRNQLSSLDVSNNTSLTNLQCDNNQISVLDVSNNIGLIILVCPFNQLSVLDVWNNTSLTRLAFANNQLSSLDISNNHALTSLHSLANNSLFCIQVENIADLPDTYFIDPHTSFSEDCGSQPVNTFTDPRDERTYITVQIGDQVWMAENLAYLPSVNHALDGSYTDPRYYVYSYDGTNVSHAMANSNYQNYGVLYNWPAAMESCPEGWHLPSDAEWMELEMNLGMSLSDTYVFGFRGTGIGDKLKATHGWYMEGNGTNESGFTALPGGYRNYDGGFFTAEGMGFWWTSTERNSDSSWDRALYSGQSTVRRLTMGKSVGYSVRCIKDQP